MIVAGNYFTIIHPLAFDLEVSPSDLMLMITYPILSENKVQFDILFK